MKSGDQLKPFAVASVSPEAMREWSVFLEDANPIHLDAQAVRDMGLGEQPINQGPANLAYAINLIMLNFPDGEIEKLDTRFTDNVLAYESVTARGEVVESSGTQTICQIALETGDGRKALECTATVRTQ